MSRKRARKDYDYFDGRFFKSLPLIRVTFDLWIEKMTVDELRRILKCAEKLEIDDYKTKPAVDVLYEIAVKLSILEKEIVSPAVIIKRIDEYLENN